MLTTSYTHANHMSRTLRVQTHTHTELYPPRPSSPGVLLCPSDTQEAKLCWKFREGWGEGGVASLKLGGAGDPPMTL